jgi:hypothetical protein
MVYLVLKSKWSQQALPINPAPAVAPLATIPIFVESEFLPADQVQNIVETTPQVPSSIREDENKKEITKPPTMGFKPKFGAVKGKFLSFPFFFCFISLSDRNSAVSRTTSQEISLTNKGKS